MDTVNNLMLHNRTYEQKLPANCVSVWQDEMCLLYKTVLTTTGQKHEFYSAV